MIPYRTILLKRLYLGFNLRESTFIARVLGLKEPAANSPLDVLAYSKELRERLRIDGVVIHWSRYAAGNDSDFDLIGVRESNKRDF
jgi:hypothetical protein